jgi:HD-GYP domain-containing protein (c-di-GMP phosphodiesterase class II)
MKLVKVPAAQLRPGMFVAELDRPWLETPFALQGFVIRNDDEVFYVADYVDYVYVDADYGGSPAYLPLHLMDRKTLPGKINIKADFQQAKVSFENAADTLDKVFDQLKKGEATNIDSVKQVIRPLIEGVFKNKDAMSALIRLKEVGSYHYHHGVAMAVWAAILGRHLGLHRDDLEKLVIGCAMCDVGMTKIPKEIIESSHSLTEDELNLIRHHPLDGGKMVSDSGEVDLEILSIIENHHERHDGSGYPKGLKSTHIPLLSRIAGLVDSYDAMITPNAYRRGRTSYEAIQELIELKGELFQDVLVEQFIQAVGLFPTGSLVELNTGEVAIVIKQNSHRRLKPEIVIVTDSKKQDRRSFELVDLAREDQARNRWITIELPPGSYGINREDFFL